MKNPSPLGKPPEMVYVVCSWINDWEAGRFPAVAPEQSQFATRDDAVDAFKRHQELLDAQADESVVQIERGADEGYLIAGSGINVVNAVFGVPSRLVKLAASTKDHKEWPDDGWELTTTLMMGFLLEDGSYSIGYAGGRGEGCLADELDAIDLEELLRGRLKGV